MALMQRLRDRTHVILWALLILFLGSMTVGGLVGGADILEIFSQKARLKDAAGIVNGKKLDLARYYQMVDQQLEQYRQNDQEVTDMDMERISESVWQNFVETTLLDKQIKQLGIKVSDDEVYQTLVNNPPQFLLEHEAFQTDGKFDYQKYLNALNHPQSNEWQPVEEYVRSYLPYTKVSTLINNLPTVSETEIEQEYLKTKAVFDFQTLVVPFTLVAKDSLPVSDEEIAKYYKENKEKYLVPDSRELEYVKFELTPTRADSQAVYQQILDLRRRILAGENFETVAAEFTEDPSGSKNGGDLGWFGKGTMVEPFEKAAFSLGKGQISNPVLTSYGYHLIKVEDRRSEGGQPQVKARHILLKIRALPETIENIRSKANLFAIDAADLGFAAAADSHKVTIQKTPVFTEKDRYIPGLGAVPAALRFAFSDRPEGSVSEVIPSDNVLYIFRLSKVTPQFYRPLAEIKDQLRNILLNEKRTQKLEEIARKIYTEVQQTGSLESALEKNPLLQLENYTNHNLSTPLRGFIMSYEVTGTLKGLKPGQISRPIKISTRFVIIKMIQKSPFDQADYQASREALRQQLLFKKKNQAFYTWMSELKQGSKIIDNRKSL